MRRSRSAVVAVSLGLFALALAVHWTATRGAFLSYDDDKLVTANPQVQRGLDSEAVAWAFRSMHAGNWVPLAWLSHALDVRLYGLDPWGHHLSSLLLHAASATLLYLAWRRMTGEPWRSAAVAALFAVHPLHVESVAWVSERRDVLSGFFGWLSLLAWAAYVERPRWRAYLAAFACFALSLLAKSTWLTLPFALLLLDHWPLRRWRRVSASRLLLEKVPLLVLSGAVGSLAFVAQSRWGTVHALDDLSLAARLANACLAYVGYLGAALWPTGLAVPYPHPGAAPPLLETTLSAGVLLAATAAAIHEATRRPWLVTGWLWYLGTLVPMLGLVQVGGQARADRYAYLPLVGVYVAVVWSAAEAAGRLRVPRRLLAAGFAAVLAALAVATRAQIGHWRDSISLFERALAVTSPNPIAHVMMARALVAEGHPDGALAHLDAAGLDHAAEVLVLRAGLLVELHREAEAEEAAEAALRLEPGHPEALFHLGVLRHRHGRYAEAVELYREALRRDPEGLFLHARHNLALALERLGDLPGARRGLEAVLRIQPGFVPSQLSLARLAAKAGAAPPEAATAP